MKILVTGGAGFIGSHIAEAAIAAGHEVAALDDLSSGKRENLPEGVGLYQVDIRDRDAVRKVMNDYRPHVLSHQAAQASVSVSMRDPALDGSTNVVGGANVLLEAIEAGVERYVFASTGGAIYGNVPAGEAASEDWSPNPESPYAIHKFAHEQLLAVMAAEGRIATTVLRYANVYGPRQDPHGEAGVVAIFFQKAIDGQDLAINALQQEGDDGCTRDYTFVADAARANVAALEGKLQAPLMNVGTGRAISTRHLAARIVALSGSRSKAINTPHRPGDIAHSTLNPERFRSELGEPTELDFGLKQTADWYAGQLA